MTAKTQRDCIDEITAELARLTVEVASLTKTLKGNGEPGLIEQSHMNTAHRERMETIIDGLWLKVLLIWLSSMGTVAALIKFLAGR